VSEIPDPARDAAELEHHLAEKHGFRFAKFMDQPPPIGPVLGTRLAEMRRRHRESHRFPRNVYRRHSHEAVA
jgi:hypothetical protein